jgi:YD repeat-containing protein
LKPPRTLAPVFFMDTLPKKISSEQFDAIRSLLARGTDIQAVAADLKVDVEMVLRFQHWQPRRITEDTEEAKRERRLMRVRAAGATTEKEWEKLAARGYSSSRRGRIKDDLDGDDERKRRQQASAKKLRLENRNRKELAAWVRDNILTTRLSPPKRKWFTLLVARLNTPREDGRKARLRAETKRTERRPDDWHRWRTVRDDDGRRKGIRDRDRKGAGAMLKLAEASRDYLAEVMQGLPALLRPFRLLLIAEDQRLREKLKVEKSRTLKM